LVFAAVPTTASLALNPHPIGVWYNGSNWTVFNQDKANMPIGASFILTLSPRAILTKASGENLNNDKMFIDAEPLNGNSAAKFTVTQNWNPGGVGGIYNNSDLDISFNNGLNKWVIQNKSGAAIPTGAAFNIVEKINEEPIAINTPSARPNPPSNLTPVVTNPPAAQSADPAIYQFMINNRINYPATKKEPVLKGSTQIGSFVEKNLSQTTFISENVVFNPPADVMYAGSLIQSKPYFEDNRLSPINKPIKPGTITVVGGNGPGSGSYSRQLSNNTLEAYKDALQQILQSIDMKNSQGSNQFSFKSCRSVEQGMVNVGINFRVTNFSGEAGLNNKSSTEKSYVVGLIKQVYYSVSYRPTTDNQNLFLAPTTLSQLQSEGLMAAKNQPAYISQVDYGRMFLLVAESESSSDSLKAFLEANYRGGTVQVNGRLDYAAFKSRNSVTVSIYSVGSNDNSKDADDISEEAFRNFLRSGATASLSNPGAPIAFRVRDFISGTDIPTALTADYTEVTGTATPLVYEYFVKPGFNGGRTNTAKNGTQLILKKGDIVSISADGNAQHGAWIGNEKGPDGQNGEATDPNDPMPCGSNQRQRTDLCECNRYAIICNLPDINTTKKIYTCVGGGFLNKVIQESNNEPLMFTFNDYNTSDGGGNGFNIRVSVIPKEQVVKMRVAEGNKN
jgi:Thiol-activated cytolysin